MQSYFEWIRSSEIIWRYYCKWDLHLNRWSYNLETILAEKLQTVLARGILNTRMRDFYDIRMLLDTYEDKVNKAVLKDAFAATCNKRGTDHLQEQAEEIIKIIEADTVM